MLTNVQLQIKMRSNPKLPLSTTRRAAARVRLGGWGVLRTLARSLTCSAAVAVLSPSLPLSLSLSVSSTPPFPLSASAWSRTVVVDISTATEKEEN